MSNCKRIMLCNGLASGPFFTRHTFSKHLVNILPNVILSKMCITLHNFFFCQISSTGSCCIKRVSTRDSRSQSVSALCNVVWEVYHCRERHGSRSFYLVGEKRGKYGGVNPELSREGWGKEGQEHCFRILEFSKRPKFVGNDTFDTMRH